jgi:hypothetical protein
VVSYLKNGWENDFIDKYKQLRPDISNAPVPANLPAENPPEFPQAANWQPIFQVREKFPMFTIENIMTYFLKRKAGDNKENNDYKNLSSLAFGLFKHGHVQKIEVTIDEDANMIHIKCECLPEMKKNIKYQLCLSMVKSGNGTGDITFASCSPCPAGKAPYASCKHIAALCYALEEFVRIGKSDRDYQTCTSRLQTWNQPRKRKLDSSSVYEIDFSKKVYGKDPKKARKLQDPRLPAFRESRPSVANQVLLENINIISLDCGFSKIMSREKPKTAEHIISPPKAQPVSIDEIYQRAEKVKKNLFVSDAERNMISNKTQQQSKTKLWNEYRKYRITASKCKRALQNPTTSPTKAISEILHYKTNFQTQKMRQGLEDECKILKLYEDKLGCKVHKVGFIISSTHPFLGASPDGEVFKRCLVEVKRIFPGEMSLTQAVCKRRICKMQCGNQLVLNEKHQYFYQVQQQLYCMEYEHSDLVISDLKDILIFSVKKKTHFANTVVPKLEEFYNKYLATELAYPRIALGLPRLGKVLREI